MSEPNRALPEIDFATFVLSLASSAVMHLGEFHEAEGAAAPSERDLPLAKQTIDMLAMLEQKTRGNLDAAEEQLLTGVLYDLRLKYVDATKSPTK